MAWAVTFAAVPVVTHTEQPIGTPGERPAHLDPATDDYVTAGVYVTVPDDFGSLAGERYWVGRVYADDALLSDLEGHEGVVTARLSATAQDQVEAALAEHFGAGTTAADVADRMRSTYGEQQVSG